MANPYQQKTSSNAINTSLIKTCINHSLPYFFSRKSLKRFKRLENVPFDSFFVIPIQFFLQNSCKTKVAHSQEFATGLRMYGTKLFNVCGLLAVSLLFYLRCVYIIMPGVMETRKREPHSKIGTFFVPCIIFSRVRKSGKGTYIAILKTMPVRRIFTPS